MGGRKGGVEQEGEKGRTEGRRMEGETEGREGGQEDEMKGRWQEGGGKRNREETAGGFVLSQKGSNDTHYLYLDHSFIAENDVLWFMFLYNLLQFT